ncbi:class I SAM-dependent methyltransferase [Sphingomicrobium marinum]|uniref:class I SAM-dependent methyltransferase n=1 Tax=Sphingomicrobium marinum TaxID=1227950 RepID=UPI00223F63FC|nr:SAM-dependent methyltransferase [Sphingomicrobium marinum]
MSLAEALEQRIAAEGPISLHDYMAASNAEYYASRDPLGKAGDFTTAPEISQMFGELVGASLADVFARAGRPDHAAYAELGPGRGTLASDVLRLMGGIGFEGDVHFVETSPVLRNAQRERHPDATWHKTTDSLPDVPLLIVANEFFDALPVRQWVGDAERKVAFEGGGFRFSPNGTVTRETCPAAEAIAGRLGGHLARHGGVMLVIDYGYAGGEQGDTLQAVRRHTKVGPLAFPGTSDLTTHVDFAALAAAAKRGGAKVTRVITQGTWLETLGLGPRAVALAGRNPDRADDIAAQRKRLASEEGMGTLFKVMAVHHPDWPAPAGLGA